MTTIKSDLRKWEVGPAFVNFLARGSNSSDRWAAVLRRHKSMSRREILASRCAIAENVRFECTKLKALQLFADACRRRKPWGWHDNEMRLLTAKEIAP